eukprot:TRINITY_DN2130_c1_g1_i1.p1 TRINITY_DN2130_c1_g1~~TRINITY_DN2130_c1_g1_i1.p1  ORF type:complete len:315 (+),score=120.70 TRINITY_DN2130_c1_g1_i1:764-1708(+)
MKHEGIGGVTRFFIMNNIFNSNIYYDPIEKFDLKGATVGRFVPENVRKKGMCLKDVEFLDQNRKIWLTKEVADQLISQARNDTEFLAKHGVIDYSMLVGIHYETDDNKEELTSRRSAEKKKSKEETNNVFKPSIFQLEEGGIIGYNQDENRKEYYYLGVIDILMRYGSKKQAENFFRSFTSNKDELSAVNPGFYSSRFVKFLEEKVISVIPEKVAQTELPPRGGPSSSSSSSGKKSPKVERKKEKSAKSDKSEKKTSINQTQENNKEKSDHTTPNTTTTTLTTTTTTTTIPTHHSSDKIESTTSSKHNSSKKLN